jgi:hypothetical protein
MGSSERIYRVKCVWPVKPHFPYRVRYFSRSAAEHQAKRLQGKGALVSGIERSKPVEWEPEQQALPL